LAQPQWGALALPLWAMRQVRETTIAAIPNCRDWPDFSAALERAARRIEQAPCDSDRGWKNDPGRRRRRLRQRGFLPSSQSPYLPSFARIIYMRLCICGSDCGKFFWKIRPEK